MVKDVDETRSDIDCNFLIKRQLDKQQELLDQLQPSSSSSLIDTALATLQSSQQNSSAELLLQQFIKQILYSPIINAKCPKLMRDSILYCTSYVEAKISTKMPYVLVLDKKIADLHRKHNEFVTPALLLSRGRARNVTVEINTTHKLIPSYRPMSSGESEYTAYPKQQIVNVDDEMHLLLSLRNSSRPIQFLNYTTPSDTFKNRVSHSEYWTNDAKDRIMAVVSSASNEPVAVEQKLEPIPESVAIEPTSDEVKQEPKVEEEEEKSQEPDKRLTEAVTKRPPRMNLKQIGKERPEEVEVYVRGRGRGRYVCEQCGIKCKKPSMLKKHLNVHTDVRLFKCITCNFAFKTKGNLTKHLLFSKAHRIKVASSRCSVEIPKTGADGSSIEVITTEADVDNAAINFSEREAKFVNNEFDNKNDEDNESDNETDEQDHHHQENQPTKSWRFGQENILWQRSTHTPPTLWTLCEDKRFPTFEEEPPEFWPRPIEYRSCHSAPPAALCSPTPGRHRQSTTQNLVTAASSLGFNVEMSPPMSGDGVDLPLNNELLTNYIAMAKPLDAQSTNSVNDFDFNSLFGNESQELQCEQCDKKFRKASDLHFHKQTHLIEQQQSQKARTYQCLECKVVHRSKALLEKHMAEQHENLTVSDDPSPINDLDNLTNSVASGSNFPINELQPPGRKYWCSDCNIGFRTHGVLAKHLRTKNHVKSLAQQGKLPDDSLTLIKDNASYLANVDATNCEQARLSLLKILDRLRGNQSGDSKNGSLECEEQLPSTTELAIGISQKHASNFQHQKPTVFAGQKRKNSERYSEGETASQRPRSNSCMIGISSSAQKRLVGNELYAKSGASTPGGFNSTTAYRLSANGRTFNSFAQQSPIGMNSTSHIVGANVWTPPLVDQLIMDEKHHQNMEMPIDSVASSMKEEIMSESTGRSESSTPVQRQNNHNHAISSPIPMTTVCMLCDHNFDSPANLYVHLNAEHITFHDGNDFKCPRRNCDKTFPNRISLRHHIQTHFFGGATPIEESNILMSPSEIDSNNDRKTTQANGTTQVPNHSPGAPEATHTVAGEDPTKVERPSTQKPEEQQQELSIACNMCSSKFSNAQQLQSHWVSKHLAELNALKTHMDSHR